MKKRILISTIVRNRAAKLDKYFSQIREFVERLSDRYDFSITIYENDSTDDSKKKLEDADYSLFNNHYIKCEDIGTGYYGSIVNDNRVINYANARNKTFEGVDINEFDYLLIIEPDIHYTFDMMEELITFKSLSEEPDIYSGVLMMNGVPYDIWGMRRHKHEEWGGFMSDPSTDPIKEFWSTANGICVYNMEPFKKGLKFSAKNNRLGKFDCDTAVLCEDFRAMGYNKILVNQAIQPIHEQ